MSLTWPELILRAKIIEAEMRPFDHWEHIGTLCCIPSTILTCIYCYFYMNLAQSAVLIGASLLLLFVLATGYIQNKKIVYNLQNINPKNRKHALTYLTLNGITLQNIKDAAKIFR